MLVFVRPITAHWSPVGRDFPGHQTGPGGGPVFPRKQDRVLAKEVGHAQGLGWQSAGHVSHPSGLGCPLSSGVQGLPNTKGLWSHSPTAFCISTPATGGGGGRVPSFPVSGDGTVRPGGSQICPQGSGQSLGYSSSVGHPFDF